VAVHRVCVVGVGYVGLPLAALLARQFPVVGFDVDQKKVARLDAGEVPLEEPGLGAALAAARSQGNLRFTSRPEEIAGPDVKILTVGTPYDEERRAIDYAQLDASLGLVVPRLAPGDVVIVKSTVPPGTTGRRVRRLVEAGGHRVPDDVGLAFSPERVVEGQALRDFTSLPKIIGATDDRSFEVTREVLGSLGGPVRRVATLESAEMVKMVDNYARYVFLGLTNELALVSEKVGVDVLELIDAAKFEYPRNAGLLRPGPGVGGSCLNKDPFILASVVADQGLDLEMVRAATRVNRSIPGHIVDRIDRPAGPRRTIAIGGVAFKGDTDDTRFSPVFEIAKQLAERGYSVRLSDPFARVDGHTVERDLLRAAAGADIVLLLTDHSAYRTIDLAELKRRMLDRPLLVDTRGLVDRAAAEQLGFEYRGYGRP
jgi:dTDP-alpha-D-glucose dehydrogenase